jgi:hypothetical protein
MCFKIIASAVLSIALLGSASCHPPAPKPHMTFYFYVNTAALKGTDQRAYMSGWVIASNEAGAQQVANEDKGRRLPASQGWDNTQTIIYSFSHDTMVKAAAETN